MDTENRALSDIDVNKVLMLTTAGGGTWMLRTEHGRILLYIQFKCSPQQERGRGCWGPSAVGYCWRIDTATLHPSETRVNYQATSPSVSSLSSSEKQQKSRSLYVCMFKDKEGHRPHWLQTYQTHIQCINVDMETRGPWALTVTWVSNSPYQDSHIS